MTTTNAGEYDGNEQSGENLDPLLELEPLLGQLASYRNDPDFKKLSDYVYDYEEEADTWQPDWNLADEVLVSLRLTPKKELCVTQFSVSRNVAPLFDCLWVLGLSCWNLLSKAGDVALFVNEAFAPKGLKDPKVAPLLKKASGYSYYSNDKTINIYATHELKDKDLAKLNMRFCCLWFKREAFEQQTLGEVIRLPGMESKELERHFQFLRNSIHPYESESMIILYYGFNVFNANFRTDEVVMRLVEFDCSSSEEDDLDDDFEDDDLDNDLDD